MARLALSGLQPRLAPYWRLLLAGSVIVPTLLGLVAAWQDRERLLAEGHADAVRVAALAREHALKVTETNLLVLNRIEDRVHGLDWSAILARQEPLHHELRSIDEQIEQISALHLVTPEGRIAAVSTVFPAPAVPIRDRSYFQRHAAGEQGPLFGEPIVSRISGRLGFTVTRRRNAADGGFDGIVFGSFLPDYFERHWRTVAANRDLSVVLLRSDGVVLAEMPRQLQPGSAIQADGELMRAIGRAPEEVATMRWTDDKMRLVSIARVGDHPLHVVAALPLSTIEARWHQHSAIISALAILSSVCLCSLTLHARRRSRSAQDAMIMHMATHDSLTGLPNRAHLEERLGKILSSPTERSSYIALLMIDLDRFKPVNDLHGHAAGDLLLQLVAKRLRSAARDGDVVARLGGDEFVIVATFEDAAGAEVLAEHVVSGLQDPFNLGGVVVQIGGSVGVALSAPETSFAEVLAQRADAALYRAKAEGRNCFRVFEPGMDEKLRERAALEADFRQSILSDTIEPHFQPMVDFSSGRVIGFEMLARWSHPVRGLVPPADFIPLAESSGLIGTLTQRLLHRACALAASWPADLVLACNISPLQLRDRSLPSVIQHALTESGLPPERFELELTESALVRDYALAREALSELKALGIRLALDDFGTGYSSLAHLQALPFDKIKIDRNFVASMIENLASRKIVAAVVGLGHSFGLVTVAEGVETTAQAKALSEMGCDVGQGWLFSPALPAESIAAFLSTESQEAN